MPSFVNPDKVSALNEKVYEKASIDREHLMEFLTLIDTNDAQSIIQEVKKWLTDLHDDPKFDKIHFPKGDIDAIIGDLDSYGRIQSEHLFEYKANSSRTVPMS
jgi:hypothetical protein